MTGGFIKKLSILIVLVTFAFSWLGAAIVFPIFAPLFLGHTDTIFRSEIPEGIRAILFGVFLASFPLAQFLCAPVIGEYSDREGRKKAFIFTIFLECIGYLLSAAGVLWHHLSILFLGRFITGLGAGNLSVCLATLADFSQDEKTRVRYFGMGSAISGFMFVIGPFIGGRLSVFGLDFPLWVGAAFVFVNLVLITLFFRETLNKQEDVVVDPMQAIHNVQIAFQSKEIRGLYVVYFCFLFAWNMLYQFLPAVLVEAFDGTSGMIGNLSALMGVIWFAGTLIITTIVNRTRQGKWVEFGALILFALMVSIIPFPQTLTPFVIICAGAVFFAGGAWPILMGYLSKLADPSAQGKVFGMSQSVQSLSMLLAPFLGGFFLQAHEKVPFIVAAIFAFIAAILLARIKKI